LYAGGDLPEQQMTAKKGNYIYIFGGVINGISNRIFRFNILTKAFERLPVNLIEPRAGGRAVLDYTTGQIFIIGGYNENSSALSSVEIFNDYDGTWFDVEQGPQLNFGRTYPVAEYVNGYIYVLGGYNENNEPESAIEILTATVMSVNAVSHPTEYKLMQNYPNPFNPETNISFSLPHSGFVSVDVYNCVGEKAVNLISGNINAGTHNIKWNGKDDAGNSMPSGIYLLKLSCNSFSETKKMMLLR
ncbi:MAG: T9SS type A sorting domain-containing protein, partial [Ignavibacteriaceae bacterium]|nr:T9SS type A sorting domain-containing protein [Ignavibacteriaceae bacterium]